MRTDTMPRAGGRAPRQRACAHASSATQPGQMTMLPAPCTPASQLQESSRVPSKRTGAARDVRAALLPLCSCAASCVPQVSWTPASGLCAGCAAPMGTTTHKRGLPAPGAALLALLLLAGARGAAAAVTVSGRGAWRRKRCPPARSSNPCCTASLSRLCACSHLDVRGMAATSWPPCLPCRPPPGCHFPAARVAGRSRFLAGHAER